MLKKIVRKLTGSAPAAPFQRIPEEKEIQPIRQLVPGFLHEGNLWLLDKAVSRLQPGQYMLEVGAFCGLSASLIAFFSRKHRKECPLISVDIWKLYGYKDDEVIPGLGISYSDYRRHMMRTCQSNISFFSAGLPAFSIEAYSDDFFSRWKQHAIPEIPFRQNDKGLGFAFIDGDHRYDQARKDFLHVDSLLIRSGLILFDDSADHIYIPGDCEVSRLIREILATGAYRVVGCNPNYLLEKVSDNPIQL